MSSPLPAIRCMVYWLNKTQFSTQSYNAMSFANDAVAVLHQLIIKDNTQDMCRFIVMYVGMHARNQRIVIGL